MSRYPSTRLVWAAVLWLGSGCTTQPAETHQSAQPQVKEAPATPIAVQKAELGKPTWDPAWDTIIEKALPPEMLSSGVARDVKQFCPRFNGMSDLPRFSQPKIAGVSRFWFEGEYSSPPSSSGLWGCGKRSLLSTSP